jgi:hypothetical protein
LVLEELVITKSAWGPDLYDMSAWNEAQIEEVNSFDFEELLVEDIDCATYDEPEFPVDEDILMYD